MSNYKTSILLIAITCMVIIAFTAMSEPPEKQTEVDSSYGPRDKQGADNQETPPPGFPAGLQTGESHPQEEGSDSKQAERKGNPDFPDNSLGWPQGTIAIFTVVLAITAVLQTWIIYNALKATKLAADAAKESANAATATAMSIRLSETAYVFVRIGMDSELSFGKNTARLVLTNCGKTPAILLGYGIEVKKWPSGEEIPEDFLNSVSETPAGSYFPPRTVVIGSGADQVFEHPFPVTPTEVQQITKRSLRLFCTGLLRYEDVFRGAHNVSFCWEYQNQTKNFYPSNEQEFNDRS